MRMLAAEGCITDILNYIGDDAYREELDKTPERVVASWKEIYAGYKIKRPAKILESCIIASNCDQIICFKDIEFTSMCEHHMLPFFGKAHIAYIPQGKIVGASKPARLLEAFARRLQIQERITTQVAETMQEVLNPIGSACIIEAKHLCMCARGVGKQHSIMVTSSMLGAFREKAEARQELLTIIKGDSK